MAKMKRPVGDHVSGKLGNVVFYQLRGKSYVRMAPDRKDAVWNAEQVLHRQRISLASRFWKQAREANISAIWNRGSELMNGYALFMKINMPAFALDGSVIDVHLLQLSTGKLTLPRQLKAVTLEGHPSLMKVSWENDHLLTGERLKDQLMAITTNGNKYMEMKATGLKRADTGGTFELPEKPSVHMGDFTHVYLFFASRDEKNYSPSSCFEIAAPVA